MKKIEYNEALFLKFSIENLSSKHIEATAIMKLMFLQEEIIKGLESVDKAKDKLFKDYKVEADKDGNLDWSKHKDTKEITAKFSTIIKGGVKVSKGNLNFSEPENVVKSVKELGYSIPDIMQLVKLIGKTE